MLVSRTRTRIKPPKGAWASIKSSVPATNPTSASFLRPRALGMTFTIRAVAPTGSSASDTSLAHFPFSVFFAAAAAGTLLFCHFSIPQELKFRAGTSAGGKTAFVPVPARVSFRAVKFFAAPKVRKGLLHACPLRTPLLYHLFFKCQLVLPNFLKKILFQPQKSLKKGKAAPPVPPILSGDSVSEIRPEK